MLLAVLAGFLLSAFGPAVHRAAGKYSGWVMALVPASVFGYLCTWLPEITAGATEEFRYQWVPALGLNLTLYLDGLSLFFALLISGFGTFIFIYGGKYMSAYGHIGRFYIYLLLFMGAMLGVVLSGNLISLFMFWELTSLSSFLLIGFNNYNQVARHSALQAMLITVSGGLCMLAGFIVLALATGTYNIPELLNSGDVIRAHAWYLPVMVLVLLGAFTKSAQFPFHFWLPNAMAAPTPVSAYLHSATMVKAGVYLVARFTPALGHTPEWIYSIMIVGGITMLLGAVLAVLQTDLKRILAYTTLSALGMLMLLLGPGTVIAIQAALAFLLAHALYKGALFLVAGNLDYQMRTRDVHQLSGLGRLMPYTGTAAVLACVSMAGILPVFGFIGKEMVYEAALGGTHALLITVAVVAASVLFVSVAIELSFGVFFGKVLPMEGKSKSAEGGMLVAPLALATFGLVAGLMPATLVQPLLQKAAGSVVAEAGTMSLSLWHGFNLALLLSGLTLALGIAAFRLRFHIRKTAAEPEQINRLGPARFYEYTLKALVKTAINITRFLQNGRLQIYLLTILSLFVALAGYQLIFGNLQFNTDALLLKVMDFSIYELVIIAMVPIGLVMIFMTRSRLTALAAMGVVGYAVALVFILFEAPDVAVTQFLIETLTVVLFVLVLHKLPTFRQFTKGWERVRGILVAVLFGTIMAATMLLVIGYDLDSALKSYFAESSYPLGKGRNIVNVILVDFRGLDTMGEIIVLAIASIGILSLLKLRLGTDKKATSEPPSANSGADENV